MVMLVNIVLKLLLIRMFECCIGARNAWYTLNKYLSGGPALEIMTKNFTFKGWGFKLCCHHSNTSPKLSTAILSIKAATKDLSLLSQVACLTIEVKQGILFL